MYLSASLCISFLGIFMIGGITLIDIHVIFIDSCCFVIHWLLIYIYELFIHICLYFVLCESYKNVIPVVFTLFCHTCVYAFVEYFRNIQVDSTKPLSTLATDG